MQKLTVAIICVIFITRCVAQPKPEFRGVWIATVDNIDWPIKGEL